MASSGVFAFSPPVIWCTRKHRRPPGQRSRPRDQGSFRCFAFSAAVHRRVLRRSCRSVDRPGERCRPRPAAAWTTGTWSRMVPHSSAGRCTRSADPGPGTRLAQRAAPSDPRPRSDRPDVNRQTRLETQASAKPTCFQERQASTDRPPRACSMLATEVLPDRRPGVQNRLLSRPASLLFRRPN